MKRVITILLAGMALQSHAQWAIGVQAGVGYDHTWVSRTRNLGARVEHRFADSSRFVWRVQADVVNMDGRFSRDSEQRFDPYRTSRIVESLDHTQQVAYTLDVKYALAEAECEDGYFKGWYTFTGLSYLRSRTHSTLRIIDLDAGLFTQRPSVTVVEQLRLRAGLGVQRSWSWGALFGEGYMTLGGSTPHGRGLALPASLGMQLGYRYLFRKR